MDIKNLWSKLGLIVVLVGMCAWQLWPPKDKLKPGIDLGGGHSLLFEVDDSGLAAPQRAGLATKVMNILKQRVDPQGNRNLVWRPIGRNRIEIQMPRPSEHMAQFRDEYEVARTAVMVTNISEAEIRNALTKPAGQREAAFDQLIRGVASREPLFDKLVKAVSYTHLTLPTN